MAKTNIATYKHFKKLIALLGKLNGNVGSYVQFCVAPAAKLHIAYVVPRFYLCVLKWGTTEEHKAKLSLANKGKRRQG